MGRERKEKRAPADKEDRLVQIETGVYDLKKKLDKLEKIAKEKYGEDAFARAAAIVNGRIEPRKQSQKPQATRKTPRIHAGETKGCERRTAQIIPFKRMSGV